MKASGDIYTDLLPGVEAILTTEMNGRELNSKMPI